MPAFKKIVIIGLGLMGGSLAAAARKKFASAEIVGVARRPYSIQTAKKKKWIHAGYLEKDLRLALDGADLAVICTPVDLIEGYLTKIDKAIFAPIIVTDIGSVQSTAANSKKRKYVNFIGAHPMVGSHERGIDAARGGLYEKGLTLITGKKNQTGFKEVCFFWKTICREIKVMTPDRHNALVSQISHLPHLLSVCLAQTPEAAALTVAGTGFKDTTRLAEGDASVWAPIFQQNRKEVLKAIRSFNNNLRQFESALKTGKPTKLTPILKLAAQRRGSLR